MGSDLLRHCEQIIIVKASADFDDDDGKKKFRNVVLLTKIVT